MTADTTVDREMPLSTRDSPERTSSMSFTDESTGKERAAGVLALTVGVALTRQLHGEAYAARIRAERGLSAVTFDLGHWPPHPAERITVALVDRCPREALNGAAPRREPGDSPPETPSVLLVSEATPGAPCDCCRRVSDRSDWPALLAVLRGSSANGRRAPVDPFALLSNREREVLKLVALGLSVKSCAERLAISESTAGNHKHRLMKKLGIRSSLELMRVAMRAGLVDC
ncbi:MAG: response regulator transcription factor [Lacipirellulaceae bacterium]